MAKEEQQASEGLKQELQENEDTAREAALHFFEGSEITSMKTITSFDNMVFLVKCTPADVKLVRKRSKELLQRAVVRFPRQNPASRPQGHNPARQAWACKLWRDSGKSLSYKDPPSRFTLG